MKIKFKNTFYIAGLVILISSCGSDEKPQQETTFYKKENVSTKQLELSRCILSFIKNANSNGGRVLAQPVPENEQGEVLGRQCHGLDHAHPGR